MYIGEDYKKFLSAGKNRRDFIIEWLGFRGVKAVVMPMDGHEHIYVVFPKEAYNPLFKIKTVIAHYDIFEGSPGANDNSSSVFALMNWAVRLNESGRSHNVRLIFTDGEEIAGGLDAASGVSAQGAFALASVFRRLNILSDDVFVFDCMGRGTVPVLSKTAFSGKISAKFSKDFSSLVEKTQDILFSACSGRFVTLPVSYSDNAGFLACGIAAVCITMLPQEEAERYMFFLSRYPDFEAFVLNHQVAPGADKQELEEMLPETWKKLHTEKDSIDSLDEESFLLCEKIFEKLAALKTPAL